MRNWNKLRIQKSRPSCLLFLFFFLSFFLSFLLELSSDAPVGFSGFTKGRGRSVREEKHVPWIEGTIPSVVTRRSGISRGVLHERSAITPTRAAHVGQVSSLYFSSPGSFVSRTVPDAFSTIAETSARLIPDAARYFITNVSGRFSKRVVSEVQYRISLAR